MVATRKNTGDFRLSAAARHRKASGDYENAQSFKLISRVHSGKTPVAPRRFVQQKENDKIKNNMSPTTRIALFVGLLGSVILVSYKIISDAIESES